MNLERQPGGETPRIIQNVYAFGGFAYGAINADVHVHGDGRPVYTLAEHRPPTGEPNPRWRQQPSRLLDAQFGVVPFTGRESELADLAAWRDQEDDLAVRWLHGPGGRGKTRLAGRFAELSAAAGWKLIEVHHGGQITPESQGSQDIRTGDRKGLLVLVDYADRWSMQHLDWLFANRLFSRQTPVPVRVLLIARSAHSWPAVRSQLARRGDTSAQALDELPHRAGDRERVFDAARSRFAQLYGIDDPSVIREPRALGHYDFGLTLTLHISALVGADAHISGRSVPVDSAGLSAYLLDREREFWTRLHENVRDGLEFVTSPMAMAKVVYTAALTGAVEHAVGVAAVAPLSIPGGPRRLLDDHGFCYPSKDPTLVLEPLYPDRLAEDFVALLTPGHGSADHFPDPWTTSAPAALLADPTRPWTPRAVTVLVTTAARWPHLARKVMYPLLRSAPGLAVAAGNAALIAIGFGSTHPTDENVDPDLLAVLEAIEPLLPSGSRSGLNSGILAIVERLTAYRLTKVTDLAERSRMLHNLGLHRSNADHRVAAVEAYEEVVAIYRKLAATDIAVEQTKLAGALNNLGIELFFLGRKERALTAVKEGVALFREQLTAGPAADRGGLAVSLNNLGLVLAGMRRFEEALAVGMEAIDLWSNEEDPGKRSHFLAKCLLNQSIQLSGLGRRGEALDAAEQAVALSRSQFEAHPSNYRTDLAVALIERGIRLTELSRRDEALAVFREATPLYQPDAPEAVSQMLLNFGAQLTDQQRYADTAVLSQWAADLDERADDLNSKAAALLNLGLGLERSGRAAEAVAACKEAVDILHRIGDRKLEMVALTNYGSALIKAQRYEEAVTTCQRALNIKLAIGEGATPADGRPFYNLARALFEVGQVEESIEFSRQAAESYKESGHQSEEADSLEHLGDGLYKMGRLAEAVPAYERAAALQAAYDRTREGRLGARLGVILLNLGQFQEALVPLRRAEEILRSTGDRDNLPSVLTNLGAALASVGRAEDAVTVCEEAAAICREIGARDREAMALRNLGNAFNELQRSEEAAGAFGRSADLFAGVGDRTLERQTRHHLGIASFSAGRFEEAAAAYRRELEIGRGELDPSGQAGALVGLAAALGYAEHFEEAAAAGNEAADLYRNLGDHRNEGFASSRVREALEGLNRTDEAILAGRRTVAAYRSAGALAEEGKALGELSNLLRSGGQYEESVAVSRRAAAIFQRTCDGRREKLALNNLALALYGLGETRYKQRRYEESVAANREAGALFEPLGMPDVQGSALLNECSALMELQRFAETVTAAQRAAGIYGQIGSLPLYEARALRLLGDALMGLERYEESIVALRRAVDTYGRTENLGERAMSHHLLGAALHRGGLVEASLRAFMAAANDYREVGNHDNEAAALRSLGMNLMKLGRYEEATPITRRHFELARASGDHEQESIARMMLGAMLVDTNHLEEGIAFNLESAAFFQAIGNHSMEQAVLGFVETARRKQSRSNP
ncbi:tetratricopeptide repeat protein [Glycomyces sp. NRRL B-16210]|uniref:tetratricopeptide repeat protein n=1 Tax=Glycomyces sp. NRRL B-16210 TaxID=1463821 RepID=UPI0004BEB50D|nr:tetratricopeptide repeat protein [Glycomyces sp. NRRL B-16210]